MPREAYMAHPLRPQTKADQIDLLKKGATFDFPCVNCNRPGSRPSSTGRARQRLHSTHMLRRFHFWCLIIVVAVAPAPLGSQRPLAWSLLAFGIGLLCLAWPIVAPAERRGQLSHAHDLAAPAISFGCAIAWALAQSLPGWWNNAALPLWSSAGDVLARTVGAEIRPAISIDPEATQTGIMRLLVYGGVFWLFLRHSQLTRNPYRVIESLSIIAMVYAAYGLAEYVSGTETILGRGKWAYLGDLTSTFVNRNSYATFAGLGLLCWGALLLHLRRRTAVFALGCVGIALALFCTGSRAGIAASTIGFATLLLCLRIGGGNDRRLAALLLTGWGLSVAAMAAWILFVSSTFSVGAFDRVIVYRQTMKAIVERPLLGSGLGSFPSIFEGLRPTGLVLPWHEAHNSYLELCLELGIPATLCLLGPILWSVVRLTRALLRAPPNPSALALGLAATILVATHSLVDFSAQIPAVSIYWMALLGCAMAASGFPPAGAGRLASRPSSMKASAESM
jgi:O-antigen ligase